MFHSFQYSLTHWCKITPKRQIWSINTFPIFLILLIRRVLGALSLPLPGLLETSMCMKCANFANNNSNYLSIILYCIVIRTKGKLKFVCLNVGSVDRIRCADWSYFIIAWQWFLWLAFISCCSEQNSCHSKEAIY